MCFHGQSLCYSQQTSVTDPVIGCMFPVGKLRLREVKQAPKSSWTTRVYCLRDSPVHCSLLTPVHEVWPALGDHDRL